MAEHLGRKGIGPELVLCSPSTRTRQTLTRSHRPGGDSPDIQIRPELYAAAAADLLGLLRELPDAVGSLMLIGHNPGIQDLALSLAADGAETARIRNKVPTTGALARLELEGGCRELAPGRAVLVSFVKPKELSRGGRRLAA